MSSHASDTPAAPAPAAAPPKGGRGGLVVMVAVVAILFGVGAGIGWMLRPQPETHETPEKSESHVHGPIVLHEGPHKENFETGDQRFREGSYAEALAAYREVLSEGHGVLQGALLYRVALCQEALGNADKASALYRQVVADETYPQAHVPAQLAQARLLLHTGRYAEAKHFLYPLLFAADAHPEQRSFADDTRYYLALALAQSLPSSKTGPGSWKVVSPFAIPNEMTLELPGIGLAVSADPERKAPPHEDAHADPHVKPVSLNGVDHEEPELIFRSMRDEQPKAEAHDDSPPAPLPKLEPLLDEHARPEKKADAHGDAHEVKKAKEDDHAKPTPKADPHVDEHAAPKAKDDDHAKPPPKLEPLHEDHPKPAPAADPHGDAHAPPPLNTLREPHADDHAKPGPKADPHHDNHGAPPAHADPHDHGHAKRAPKVVPKREPDLEDKLVVAVVKGSKQPIVQRGRLATQPAKSLLERLAAAGKTKIEWSVAAEGNAHDRTLRIDIVEWPLHDLVHLLTDSLELISWIDGDVVRIATPGESPKELVDACRWNLAQQAARTALIAEPHHVLAPAIAIHLGRLELNADRTTEAILCYEEAIRRQVRGPWTISAWYNLGIVHSGRGDVGSARRAFFAAIDQAPGHPLAPMAYVHIARLHLEEGAIKPASLTLARVRRNYPNDQTQPSIAVLTALAQCQVDDFAAARRTLIADKKSVTASPYREAGAFVEAYAIWRLAKVDSNARPETARLIESLYTPGETISAALETRLLGKACMEIGMAPEAARVYARALAGYKGPLRPPLQVAHADALLHLDRSGEAMTILREVESGPPSRWSAEASLRLAEIEFDEGNAQATSDRCKKLWEERQLTDYSRVFPLWGNAQEALGEHEKASRCFAGNPPE